MTKTILLPAEDIFNQEISQLAADSGITSNLRADLANVQGKVVVFSEQYLQKILADKHINQSISDNSNLILVATKDADIFTRQKIPGFIFDILNLTQKGESIFRLKRAFDFLEGRDAAGISGLKAKFAQSFFEKLPLVLNQGAGIGSLLSMVFLLKKSAPEMRDAILDEIYKNADAARRAVSLLSNLHNLARQSLMVSEISCNEFPEIIEKEVASAADHLKIKHHSVTVKIDKEKFVSGRQIHFNEEVMSDLFSELFLNACKFSPPQTVFEIFVTRSEHGIEMSMSNEIDAETGKTLKENQHLSNRIFEPFFRMVNYVDERYPTLDYGLGLTTVRSLLTHLEGAIKAHVNDQGNFTITVFLPFTEQ